MGEESRTSAYERFEGSSEMRREKVEGKRGRGAVDVAAESGRTRWKGRW